MRYVALLRGIMPTNPNMRSEKFVAAFNALGFKNVRTVIASGNVVFDAASKSIPTIEKKIEDGLHKQLGFKRAAIVRSQSEIEALVKQNPFKGVKDEKPNYLLVTFFKDHRKELASVLDLNEGGSVDFMANLEKKHGKDLTSRTWKTVHRILKKMEEA